MNTTNLIEKSSTVETTAIFSKNGKERYLLKMQWSDKKSLTIVMSFPSTADELLLDQTTMLVRNGAVKNGFGGVSIVNLFSSVNNENPKQDKINSSILFEACESSDMILVCYGRRTDCVEEKERLLDALQSYRDKLYTLIDSKGLPFSHPLSPLTHEWKIEKLK